MTYFMNAGQGVSTRPVRGAGRLPPQAAVNGLIGMLPPQAQAGLRGLAEAETPVDVPLDGEAQAFRDGVFGRMAPEPFGERETAWRDGIFSPALGLGQFRRSWQQRLRMRGVGQNGNGVVVSLSDPATVREVKAAMGLLAQPVVLAAPTTYSQAWFESGSWDEAASQLWFQVAQMLATTQPISPAAMTSGTAPNIYPSGLGIVALMGSFRASPDYGAEYAASNFPMLDGATTSALAQLDATGTPMIQTAAPGAAPRGAMRASTVAMLGLGAVVVGLGVVAMGRGRRGRRRR